VLSPQIHAGFLWYDFFGKRYDFFGKKPPKSMISLVKMLCMILKSLTIFSLKDILKIYLRRDTALSFGTGVSLSNQAVPLRMEA
jgi:hypothetical protein